MPFDDSKNRCESKSSFELILNIILAIYEEFKASKTPVLITGDFNSDVNRDNRFDQYLNFKFEISKKFHQRPKFLSSR